MKATSQNEIPQWVYDDYIRFHYQTKDIRSKINWPYFNTVKGWVLLAIEAMVGKRLDLAVAMAPLHSLTSKICIEGYGKDYAVIFDCSYGSVIKKLYSKIVLGSPIPDLQNFSKEIIALRILNLERDDLALAVKDESISPLYQMNFFDIAAEVKIAQNYFRAVPQNPTNEVNQFVDFYILAHELFHIVRLILPEVSTRFMKQAKIYFSSFKEKYFASESYIEYKEAQGERFYSPEATNYVEGQHHKFWELRRELYNKQGEHFVEEIAADLFAAEVLLNIANHLITNKQISWRLDSVFPSIFLISQTVFYYTFLEERAVDFVAGKEFIFDDQESSGLLHLRGLCLLEYLKSYVNDYIQDMEEYKHMINESVAESKNYFDRYVQLLFFCPLSYTLKAVSAKLNDQSIKDLYNAVANNWSKKDKISYVSPVVEPDWLSPYLVKDSSTY